MRRLYKETDEQAARRFIRERREAADTFPALCEIIRRFDGKVYNKRFNDAIREKMERRVFIQDKQGAGHALWVYLYTEAGEQITLLWIVLPDNKRISAADFIESAKAKREENLREAAHMEEIIPTVDTRRNQLAYIKNLIESTLADLSYSEREIFNLNLRVSAW